MAITRLRYTYKFLLLKIKLKYLLMNSMAIVYVGDGHRSSFEGSPSECGGGATIMSYGLISK